jgi:hypothetical protein
MDVVRYADTAGDNADYPVPEARLYRDWIIDAFNADLPYDQFVREQIAGDVLARDGPPENYSGRVTATGFLALSRRYATAPYELWHLTLEDAIETTGRAFLGLTLRCARCHDHKFDPVTTADYYALYGIFASTTFPYAGSEEFQSKDFSRLSMAPLLPPDEAGPRLTSYAKRIEALDAEIEQIERDDPLARRAADLDRRIATAAERVRDAQPKVARAAEPWLADLTRRRDEARAQLQGKLEPRRAALRNLRRPGAPADLPVAYAVSEGKPTDVPIQGGGEPDRPGPVVPRGVPIFLALPPAPRVAEGSSGRLELARWLTDPAHPLTARVMVNRIWQHHFGRGIVASTSNFGLRGDEPTHPELLDWLAARFVADGWSIKTMHRLIVLSKIYQLSSADDPSDAAIDPGNRFLWRHDRQRFDAESLHDAMLAVAGRLDRGRPSAHPFPPIDQWHWTQHYPFKAAYPTNHRGVYLMTQRLQRHPYLGLFDGPDTNHSTGERTASTVPLQALYLMNNPVVRARASAFADLLIAAAPDPRSRVSLAYERAWGRPPTQDESDAALAYVRRYTGESAKAGAPADRIAAESWTSLARIMLTADEFLYLD